MKTLVLAAIRCSLMFTAVAALSVQPAQAFMVTLEQVGSNVVATGSGAINLTGLTFLGSISSGNFSALNPAFGSISTGPSGSQNLDEYSGFTGPASFGPSGFGSFADSGSGDPVAILGRTGFLLVPQGYVSGAALSDTMTFNSRSFASMGVTPGTYVWTWGTGLPNQNFTLIIGRTGVPDAGSTVSLLGFVLLGLAALRRKLSC